MTLVFFLIYLVLYWACNLLCKEILTNEWQSESLPLSYCSLKYHWKLVSPRYWRLFAGHHKMDVYSSHCSNTSWSCNVGFKYTKLWPMILTFIQNILYECHFPKTDRTEQTVSKQYPCRTRCMHLFYVRLWFLPILYSCTVQPNHDLYIYTFYFLSKSISMRCEFQRGNFISSWQRFKLNKYLQFCRCKCRTSPSCSDHWMTTRMFVQWFWTDVPPAHVTGKKCYMLLCESKIRVNTFVQKITYCLQTWYVGTLSPQQAVHTIAKDGNAFIMDCIYMYCHPRVSLLSLLSRFVLFSMLS